MTEHQTNLPIEVVYIDLVDTEQEKGLFGDAARRITRVAHLDAEALAVGVQSVCSQLAEAFDGVSAAVRDYELEGFDVQLEITAKGEVRLVGSASTEVKGGVTLRFHRRPLREQ